MNLEFDHVAVVVRSLTGLKSLLERLTGEDGSPTERVESQGVDVTFVGPVEILKPTAPDTGVARFLEKRGPGLHHVAYRVDDVRRLMDTLTAEGHRFTSEEPMEGRGGHRIAFLHPASTGGLLIEFLEKPAGH